MDRIVSDDQRTLLEASARFMEDVCPLTSVREQAYASDTFASRYWLQAAELGWFSMLVPEVLGGGSVSGNGVLDAALIAFKRGSLLQPGPFVGTNVVGYALARAGSEEQQAKVLDGVVSGAASAAWVVGAPRLQPASHAGLRVDASGDGTYTLSGTVSFVQDAGTVDWMLVSAESDGGVSQFLLPTDSSGVTVTSLTSLDITRAFGTVDFDRVALTDAALVGEPGGASEMVEQQLAIASVLTVAESVGAMERDFELAVQYAKDRIAFGRPIGSFQELKHSLADTSLALEMSKAVTLAAAASLGSSDGYAREAASMAKAFVAEAGLELVQTCFQVFGGIGYTWEHDQHLYLRRVTTDSTLFGGAAWHREYLCKMSQL